MANDVTGFLETFVAAAGDYNEAVVGSLGLLDSVYKDVNTEVARAGKTINVYFPDVAPVTDQGNNDWTAEDVNPNYVSLVFTQRPGKALLFRDFEQYLTAVEMKDKFVGPMFKRAAEYLNGQIASLINTTNFGANAAIIGTTPGEVTVANQVAAWNNLANAKVPLEESNNLSVLVHNQVYSNMMQDPQWVQESLVGAQLAQQAREEARIGTPFRFQPVWDQQMPTASATLLEGRVLVTNGSTAVIGVSTRWTQQLIGHATLACSYVIFSNDPTQTPYPVSSVNSDTSLTLRAATPYLGPTGTTTIKKRSVISGGTSGATDLTITNGSTALGGTGTSFDTELVPGDWLTFSTDTTKTPYQIASVTSATAAVLTAPYAGTTQSTSSTLVATLHNFTCLAMHRYAIALALRPLPEPDNKTIHWRYVNIKGIPMRLMASYQHLKNGWLVSLDFGYALAVIRPEFGQIIKV